MYWDLQQLLVVQMWVYCADGAFGSQGWMVVMDGRVKVEARVTLGTLSWDYLSKVAREREI